MAGTVSDDVKAHRRLYILKTLQVSAGYRMSAELLREALGRIGYVTPMAVLEADLAWLKQLDLLGTTDLCGMTIAMLRSEGVEVADGTTIIPGIARPRPE